MPDSLDCMERDLFRPVGIPLQVRLKIAEAFVAVRPLLHGVGADVERLAEPVRRAISRLPRVSGGIEALQKAGMLIFVRSVFLQGLVFHTPETLPDRLAFAAPYLQRYLDLCAGFGLSPAVLALSFVLSLPGVTTAVMGCDNPEQVSQNAALFDQTVTLTPSQMDALRSAFADIDPRVPDPRVWSKGQ